MPDFHKIRGLCRRPYTKWQPIYWHRDKWSIQTATHHILLFENEDLQPQLKLMVTHAERRQMSSITGRAFPLRLIYDYRSTIRDEMNWPNSRMTDSRVHLRFWLDYERRWAIVGKKLRG